MNYKLVYTRRAEKDIKKLDPSIKDKDNLLTLMNPYPSEDMEFKKVSQIVNSPVPQATATSGGAGGKWENAGFDLWQKY